MRMVVAILFAVTFLGTGAGLGMEKTPPRSDIPPDIWEAVQKSKSIECKNVVRERCWFRVRFEDGSEIAFGYRFDTDGPIGVWIGLEGQFRGFVSASR